MRVRHFVVATAVAAFAVVPAMSSAASAAAPARPSTAAAKVTKPVVKPVVKPVKPVVFTAVGTVTAVDAEARTVTLLAKGGAKPVRATSVTVTVAPTAKVVVDGVVATLADVVAGHKVSVHGTSTAGKVLVTKVIASSPEDETVA